MVWVDGSSGVAQRAAAAGLPELLAREDGWVWVDVPEPDEATAELLVERFGVHPKAARDALARNHIARLHHYGDVLYLDETGTSRIAVVTPETWFPGHLG